MDDDDKTLDIGFDTFSINVTNYKTKLTKKYLNRKHWVPKDPKIISVFIPGTVTSVLIKPKQKVKAGDILMTFEAMKMNNNVMSPIDAIVDKVNIKPGDLITKDTVLIELK